MGTIYKAENTVNGKVYIGQTMRGFEARKGDHKSDAYNEKKKAYNNHFYRAIRKYGWESFSWSILFEGRTSREELNVLEQFYIAKFDSFKNGLNSTTGGGQYEITEEVKKKIGEATRGKYTGAKSYKARAVQQLNRLTGEVVAEYACLMDAQRLTGVSHARICLVCAGKRNTAGGYVWRYKEDEGKEFTAPPPPGQTKKRAVLQVDKQTGDVIQRFDCIGEAERTTGISNSSISRVCSGKKKTTGGYIWCYADAEG